MGKGVRYISDDFLGVLSLDNDFKKLITHIKKDIDLCLELRDEKPALYYRGRKMFDIKRERDSVLFYFNKDSFPSTADDGISVIVDASAVFKGIDKYKKLIDNRLNEIGIQYPEEKMQYRLAHCNGLLFNSDEDSYCIADIEYYQENKNNWHFDLVALNTENKTKEPFFSFVEVKYGEKKVRTKEKNEKGKGGNPGIRKHLADFRNVSNSERSMSTMKTDLEKVLAQKASLGLLDDEHTWNIDINKCEYIFVLFDYDFEKKDLRKELDEIISNYRDLYEECKENTFFAFVESNDDVARYKLSKSNFLTFKDVILKYSSTKTINAL